jgi:glycogen synthase
MNVLMTADTVGGVFTYAVELAAGLVRRGARLTLVARGAPLSDAQRAELRQVPGLEVVPLPGRLEWMDDPWQDVARAGERLLELAGALRADVVHLNDFAHGALPFEAPALVVGHSCVSSWFEAVHGTPPPPAFDRYRREVARGLAGAAAVAAPTRWMLSALERHHGPLRRGRVIPNGRSPERYRPRPKEPFVLCAGRLWDGAKNAAALDAVAADLPWPVLLAGDEAHPDPAHRAAAPGPRRARLLGRLSPVALASYLERAAVYALPARYEPFGLSVLEAALCGCALVLGDIPSLRETWEGAALFVDPGSQEALREALRRVAGDAALRLALGEAARRRGLGLGPGPMVEGYLQAYRELLDARAGREEAPCAS